MGFNITKAGVISWTGRTSSKLFGGKSLFFTCGYIASRGGKGSFFPPQCYLAVMSVTSGFGVRFKTYWYWTHTNRQHHFSEQILNSYARTGARGAGKAMHLQIISEVIVKWRLWISESYKWCFRKGCKLTKVPKLLTSQLDVRTLENSVHAHYSPWKPIPIKFSSILIYMYIHALYTISSHSILLLICHNADRFFFQS